MTVGLPLSQQDHTPRGIAPPHLPATKVFLLANHNLRDSPTRSPRLGHLYIECRLFVQQFQQDAVRVHDEGKIEHLLSDALREKGRHAAKSNATKAQPSVTHKNGTITMG